MSFLVGHRYRQVNGSIKINSTNSTKLDLHALSMGY